VGSNLPLNRLWRDAVEGETALDEEQIEKENAAVRTLLEERSVYTTGAWKFLDDKLAQDFASASKTMMVTEDFEALKIVRDRARYIARLRERPKDVERELEEHLSTLRILRGEDEAPEEE
jgi:DNA-binding GntR family transcriptional regulator